MKWQDPPGDRRRSSNYSDIARKLREQPGRWALIIEGTNASVTTHINKGRYKDFAPAGDFEATSRRDSTTGNVKIWARYVGEEN